MKNFSPLHDRNILITNSSGHFAASLASRLCEFGANVLIAGKDIKTLERFADSFNEQREIYPHFGRLLIREFDKENREDHKQAFQLVAESFGGVNCWLDLDYFLPLVNFNQEDFKGKSESFLLKDVLPQLELYKTATDFLKAKRNSCILRLVPEHIGGASQNPLHHLLQAGLRSMQNSLNFDKDLGIRFLNIEVGPTEDYLLARYPNLKVNEALTEYQKLYPQAELVDVVELSTSMAFLIGDQKNNIRISQLSLSCS